MKLFYTVREYQRLKRECTDLQHTAENLNKECCKLVDKLAALTIMLGRYQEILTKISAKLQEISPTIKCNAIKEIGQLLEENKDVL